MDNVSSFPLGKAGSKMKRFAVLTTLLVALGASVTGGAARADSSCEDPSCGKVAYTTDGFVESTFDANGTLVAVRMGRGEDQPFASTFSKTDAGDGAPREPDGVGDVEASKVPGGPPSPTSEFGDPDAPMTSGCRTVDWYESGHSGFGNLLYRFHQVKHWCWDYPHIGNVSIGTYMSDVDTCCIVYRGIVAAYGWYYAWRNDTHGGHYSRRQAQVDNCIVRYGCLWSAYPWVDIWVNGNGAWLGDDGGG
jgi:hypothetical protein